MKKTMALFTVAGLSMASEFDDVADNDLHLYKLQNGITALVHTVDDELRVLPIGYHPGGSNGPHVVYTDDELRVLPIDYHPPRPRPSGSIWTDDELRILPIDHQTRPIHKPNKPIMADDDELRVLPIGYHPGGSNGPHVVYTDDELRVLPIDYHPPRPRPSGSIWTDDELSILPIDRPIHPIYKSKKPTMAADDDELRVLPIDYHPPRPRPSGGVWTDDELRILPIDHQTRPINKPNKPIMADDDDEFRILPIDYHPPRSRPSGPIRADDNDDEFRFVPSAFTHAMSKYGKDKKPLPEEATQNDDELRLIGVGPGSLTHKKNVTETAKPVEVKPKRFTTGADKLDKNISSNAADDEMRFAHFIPQYRPKREDVETKAADNTLVELSELLEEGQKTSGFLDRRRR